VRLGAYVNVVVHDDPEVARRLGEGGLSLFARFSAMHGRAVGPTSPEARRVFEGVHAAYDMTVHSRSHTPQAAILTSEFAREYGVFGPPDYCVERLRALVGLGITRFVVVGPARDAEPAERERAEHRFATEVMPALR
jgi:alkanesulfonate monooxygenase SsuD/methylene tetrahydromethanopterin reductase-like flavin-dependent oxidoreductase (luciferase family)